MKTTVLIVKFNDQPVEGAKVLIGTLLTDWRVTDENGMVSFQTDDDFKAVLPIAIRNSGAGRDVYITKAVESGDEVVVTVRKSVPKE